MADPSTPAPSEPVSTASPAESSSSSAPASDSAPQDTRAIAAQVLRESEGAAAASPAVDPSTPPPPPAAAISGDVDDADYLKLLASGSMPVDRHKAVLTNARNKARAEVEREFQAKYGWADQFDRVRAEHGMGILNGLDKAPEQTLRHLAHILGVEFTPAKAPEPEGPPPPDVKLNDGSEFYSAAQLAKLMAWKDAQIDQKLQQIDKRYRPLQERQVLNEMRQHATVEAGSILASCRKELKLFTELESDIKAAMVADPALSLDAAYNRVFNAKGLPQLQTQWESDRASQLQRKAAASSPPPGLARSVTPQRDRDRPTRDIAREVLSAMS